MDEVDQENVKSKKISHTRTPGNLGQYGNTKSKRKEIEKGQ